MARKKKSHMECQWKRRFPYASLADPVKVKEELDEIATEHGGQVEADMVVEKATARSSEMHPIIFRETEQAAAYERRLQLARQVMNSIQIEYSESPGQPTRAFEVDRTRQSIGKYAPYRAKEEILKDPDARAAFLQRALGELLVIQRKYRGLQELAMIFRAIEDSLETVKA